MKLNKGDRIKYNDSIYAGCCGYMVTVYLRQSIMAQQTMITKQEVYKTYGHRIPGKEG